jgi:tetratricopeptide (TPR) repeat protein
MPRRGPRGGLRFSTTVCYNTLILGFFFPEGEGRVAKKFKKHRGPPPLTTAQLEPRVERALNEGRFQQGLELAKQLSKQEPSPAHQALLGRAYLGRARQLRQQGFVRDAQTVLSHAMQAGGGDPAWLGQLAEELAASGDLKTAFSLLNKVTDESVQARVRAMAADAALQQGEAGRNLLPETLRGDYDRIAQAFAHSEAGRDDQVAETLQGVGLRSPFLEWKLLLRGLTAFYQQDDVRALENWQRLQAGRLPARLAAPLRFLIDPAYRAAQAPEVQTKLQHQNDRLQGSGLVPGLRGIQAALASNHSLAPAFRQAENLLPSLRQQAPQLVPRLASCLYWAVIHPGTPEDVNRYQRVFGPPADDPHFARLRALAYEQAGELEEAHREWKQFEKDVAANPASWPGGQADQVRALVWCHMGRNAASVPDPDQIPDLPPFLRDHPDRPRPLKPSAEECFRHALDLAPGQLEPYEALFEHYQKREQDDKAEEAARRLLDRFPAHVKTLEALGDLCLRRSAPAEALGFFQRALKTNPLERRLRGKVSFAHLVHARSLVEAGRFPEARAEYQAALAYEGQGPSASVLCKMAACEFKAGETARAEELLQQAQAHSAGPLDVAYSMLIEIIRLKLPRPLKVRFDKEFNAGLAEPPTAATAVALATTMSAHAVMDVKYYGQKTHEKKVLAYLDKARRLPYTEQQLEALCRAMLGAKAWKQLRDFAAVGQRRFPENPLFYFLEAESYIAQGPHRCPVGRVHPLLERARQLASRLPPDAEQKQLLEEIQKRQQMIGLFNPFAMNLFSGAFGSMFGEEEDWDDDEF